jgi:hypothetical protein
MGQAKESVKTPQLPESPKKKSHKTRSSTATSTAVTSLKTISQLKESGKAAHLRAKKTRKCYAGHVKRGRQWLAEHFCTETDEHEQSAPDGIKGEKDDPYLDPEFPNAFDCIPNKMSDKALALFLTYKGFHQNLSQEMVEGIRAAFKDLWDNA